MLIEPHHVFSTDLRVVKAALALYPESVNMRNEKQSYPLDHALALGFSRSVIKCLLSHGANPNAEVPQPNWRYHSREIRLVPMDFAIFRKNWICARMLIHYGAKITDYIKMKYTQAPKRERVWFESLVQHRERMALLVPELMERAADSFCVPPLEVKPGISVPGRQGYQDSLQSYLSVKA
jgi:hypothetical protein